MNCAHIAMRSMALLWMCCLLTFIPMLASAGGTKIWELAGYKELLNGETKGTTISSDGEIRLGHHARKLEIKDVGLVWTALKAKNKIYLGTGYEGKIFRIDTPSVVEIATTEQLVVTSMVANKKGDLFVATLPDAVIWKVVKPAGIKAGRPQKAEKWCTLPKEAEHVWQLKFDKAGRNLFAATGPQGRIYAIGPNGRATVYADTEDEHVMSLALDGQGRLLAGTSPEALVYRFTGPGRAVALADFDATEVKTFAVRDKRVYAAVNEFAQAPAIPSKKTTGKKSDSPKMSKTQKAGDGALYLLGPNGEVDRLWRQKKGHIVGLGIAQNGTVYLGLGADGEIVSVDEDRVVRSVLDLDEREVMALVVDKGLKLATTGDAGGVYQVESARLKDAAYLTPILDTEMASVWGRVRWYADGELRVTSRTGNTLKPDKTWSAWSVPIKKGAEIASPAARYLQLRFTWTKVQSSLRSAQVAYRRLNQRVVITDLDPDSPFPTPKTKSSKVTVKTSTRVVDAHYMTDPTSELDLSWSVDNPDDDTLSYRLFYQALGEKLWRPITRADKVYTSTRFTWDTQSVPEGMYRLKLVADDSPDNDPDEVLSDTYYSVPVLVDNHQPQVKGLSYKNKAIRGTAVDSFSEIVALSFSVDAGPWSPLFSEDGVFDETQEQFACQLPASVEPGPHAVAVRAFDRAGNMGTAEIHVMVK